MHVVHCIRTTNLGLSSETSFLVRKTSTPATPSLSEALLLGARKKELTESA